jgi:hypothetical protein
VRRIALSVFLVAVCQNAAFAQFGATLTGVGPINRSMGGASTAAPLDTLGAFMWNPATITAPGARLQINRPPPPIAAPVATAAPVPVLFSSGPVPKVVAGSKPGEFNLGLGILGAFIGAAVGVSVMYGFFQWAGFRFPLLGVGIGARSHP